MKKRKAGTCIYAMSVGRLGSVFVKPTCPNEEKVYIKAKDVYVIIPSKCERCDKYQAKPMKRTTNANQRQKVNQGNEKRVVRKVRTSSNR